MGATTGEELEPHHERFGDADTAHLLGIGQEPGRQIDGDALDLPLDHTLILTWIWSDGKPASEPSEVGERNSAPNLVADEEAASIDQRRGSA